MFPAPSGFQKNGGRDGMELPKRRFGVPSASDLQVAAASDRSSRAGHGPHLEPSPPTKKEDYSQTSFSSTFISLKMETVGWNAMKSESALIEWIRNRTEDQPAGVELGIGDDCAVLDVSSIDRMAVTTDSLVEAIHFRRDWSSPYFLGQKALAVNVSDLGAMGASPRGCLLNLSLPSHLTEAFLPGFVDGFLRACREFDCPLVGGNLSAAGQVQAAVTVWGDVDGRPLRRRDAKEGDRLLLVGDCGLSSAGLEILRRDADSKLPAIERRRDLRSWAATEDRYRMLRAHLLPQPPVEVGIWFRETRLANAAIDLSDGLGRDLLHILEESRLKAVLDAEALTAASRLGETGFAERTLELALNGGEDYALLVSVAPQDLDRIRCDYPARFPSYTMIGRLEAGDPSIDLEIDGRRRPFQGKGFDHFR